MKINFNESFLKQSLQEEVKEPDEISIRQQNCEREGHFFGDFVLKREIISYHRLDIASIKKNASKYCRDNGYDGFAFTKDGSASFYKNYYEKTCLICNKKIRVDELPSPIITASNIKNKD